MTAAGGNFGDVRRSRGRWCTATERGLVDMYPDDEHFPLVVLWLYYSPCSDWNLSQIGRHRGSITPFLQTPWALRYVNWSR